MTFQNCITAGIALCNSQGIATSRDYQISPITGRVELDNKRCGQTLESWYDGASQFLVKSLTTTHSLKLPGFLISLLLSISDNMLDIKN